MTHPFDWLTAKLDTAPQRNRLTYLSENDSCHSLNGETLLANTLALSERLQSCSRPGDRVLLAYPPGLGFATGFLASVHAGLIPVPVPPPKPRRPDSRYQHIARDSGACFALTHQTLADALHESVGNAAQWIGVPENSGQTNVRPQDVSLRSSGRSDDLLFLQYTSGSTQAPKGVMVSFENIKANLSLIGRGFQIDDMEPEKRVVCGWLPLYHDMGLIGILLSALAHDGHAVMLAPNYFLQQPESWLAAINKFRASVTVAPTLGYHWASTRIEPANQTDWDLSCLKVAACGAEPISAVVLDRFSAHFQDSGFSSNAFYPCYGLAESTLMVTGHDRGKRFDAPNPVRRKRKTNSIINDVNTSWVSSGVAMEPTEIRIVDTKTLEELDDEQVGEIWTSSPSVAMGYWGQPVETTKVFDAKLSNEDRSFLRTGDLGFVSDRQLYVTGRIKEVIIVGGVNHYPQDIEQTIANAIGEQVKQNRAVALPIPATAHETEGLAIIQELPRHFPEEEYQSLIRGIRVAIAAEHNLAVAAIYLARIASLPTTSSGKLRRLRAGTLLQENKLPYVYAWQQPTDYDESIFLPISASLCHRGKTNRLESFIERCLLDYLRANTAASETIQADTPLVECGLDSLRAVEMARQLELWLGMRLSPVVAFSHPNAQQLASYLAGLLDPESTNDSTDFFENTLEDIEFELVHPERLEQLVSQLEDMDDQDAEQSLAAILVDSHLP